MKTKLIFFYQYIHDYPNACAVRGNSIINQFINDDDFQIIVYNTNFDGVLNGVKYKKISTPIKNTQGVMKRLTSELFTAFILSCHLMIEYIAGKKTKFFLSSPCFIPVLCSSLLLKFLKASYYLDIRDLYPLVYFENGLIKTRSIPGRILSHYEKICYANASHIFCATNGLKKIVEPTNAATSVVLNGYPDSCIKVNLDVRHNERLKICHVGTLGHYQNVEMLKQVISSVRLRACDFIIVGEGPRQHLIESLSQENVTFLNPLPHEQVLDIMSNSDIGLSFRKENFLTKLSCPVKDFEYAASGLHVVSSPVTESGRLLAEMGLGKSFRNNDSTEVIDYIRGYRRAKITTPLPQAFEELSRSNQSQKVYSIIAKGGNDDD